MPRFGMDLLRALTFYLNAIEKKYKEVELIDKQLNNL